MKRGARGPSVGRLHRALRGAGFDVDPREAAEQELGPSTLEALHSLQRQRGLPVVDEIDETTLAVLIEIEQNVTINFNEGSSGQSPPEPVNPHHGRVTGSLVDGDGAPLPATRVVLFAKQLRAQTLLGEGKTGTKGAYVIHYHREAPVNLLVEAYDDTGKVIATSPLAFAAATQVQIDFTTARDGVVRSPSTFVTLQAEVTAQLHGMPLADLEQNAKINDIRFVASSIGASFASAAYLFMAHVLGAKNALRDETLFGIFSEGIPASLAPALSSLPENGIDDAFMAQAMAGVLAHSRDILSQALTTAVVADVLPASYADTQDLELDRLDDLRVQATASAPYIRGKTPLSDVLGAGAVTSAVQTAFLGAYAANGGQLGPTWKAL
ncbi:MAG TPA: peptidoglycan-binding domain-containing protein, partial [Polyangiaceae bacterium]